jgi:hypothetical protein
MTQHSMDFWTTVDELKHTKSEGYDERLRAFLALTPTPLRTLLAARSEALEGTRPYAGFVEALVLTFSGWIFRSKRDTRIRNNTELWEKRVATLDRLLQPMYRDIQNIGLLLDTFDLAKRSDSSSEPSWLQSSTYIAIIRLLRYVSPSQAPQFNAVTRDTLYSFLHDQKEVVVIDALSAIAEVGDNRVVETVTRLATWDTVNAREERIHKAARKSLATLTARLEKEKLAKRLLRPSEQPEAEQSLLRPAKGSENEDAELLLRSISDDR